jgi:hypothetical protein
VCLPPGRFRGAGGLFYLPAVYRIWPLTCHYVTRRVRYFDVEDS